MPVPLEQMARALSETLPLYDKRKGPVLNETTPRDIGVAGRLLMDMKEDWKGGLSVKEKLQFQEADVGRWVPPGAILDFKGTPPITWSEWYLRGWRGAVFVSDEEIQANEASDEVKLHDLRMQVREDCDLAMVKALYNALWARDGNWKHDGTENYLAMFGLRHLLTIDGLHITGDTSRTVGGINPSTQTNWRNPYISPVAASDGLETIKSVLELTDCWDRALYMLNYTGVGAYGALASGIKGVPDDEDRERRAKLGSGLYILVDAPTYLKHKRILFSREDTVGYDQGRSMPLHRGIEVWPCEELGTTAQGYGKDAAGNALWTDRGGSYASGNWPSQGESLVVNTKYFRFRPQAGVFPKRKPSYVPQGMDGIATEFGFRGQLTIRSRKRGGVYIGPFSRAA